LESGRSRDAAALFDSISRRPRRSNPSIEASDRLWGLILRACALAAARDTASLARIADSAEALGRPTTLGALHHHVRGLLSQARGQLGEAEREYRGAITSPTMGFSQTSLRLAETLVAANRPRDAAAVIASALRGQDYGPSGLSNRTAMHEALARAFDAAGM